MSSQNAQILGEEAGRIRRDGRSKDRLSKKEENELIRRYKAGDKAAGDKIIVIFRTLVVSIAQRYTGYKYAADDMIQDGNIGLCKALEKFDPDKGFRFSTYAVHHIRSEILRSAQMNANIVKMPTDGDATKCFSLQKRRREK